MSKKLSFPEVTSNFFIKSNGIFSLGFNLFLSIWFKYNDLFVNINSLFLRLYPFRSNFTTLTPYYIEIIKIIWQNSQFAQVKVYRRNYQYSNRLGITRSQKQKIHTVSITVIKQVLTTYDIFGYKINHFYFLYCTYIMYIILINNLISIIILTKYFSFKVRINVIFKYFSNEFNRSIKNKLRVLQSQLHFLSEIRYNYYLLEYIILSYKHRKKLMNNSRNKLKLLPLKRYSASIFSSICFLRFKSCEILYLLFIQII